jgi:hypothetical protein
MRAGFVTDDAGGARLEPVALNCRSGRSGYSQPVSRRARRTFNSAIGTTMSHASMLKARRQHQKTKRMLAGAAKQLKREAKQASKAPAAKKTKVTKGRTTKVELTQA